MDTLIILGAKYVPVFIALVAVGYFLYAPCKQKAMMMFLGAVTLPLAFVLGKMASLLVQTQRPFAVQDAQPVVAHIADNGFPSEHTLYALIIAGVIFMVHRKLGIFLLGCAVSVGVARVFALVHNPVDILGSIIVAATVFGAVYVTAILRCGTSVMSRLEKYCGTIHK